MLFAVEAQVVVKVAPATILEFVMDVERYRAADRKIRRVRSVERTGNEAVVAMRTRFRGLPVPARQRMVLSPGVSIEVRNVPSWQDRVVDFTGLFTCEPAASGTLVTHRYVFDVHGPLHRVFDKLFRRWLDEQIHDEVARIKQILEGQAAQSDRPG